MIKLIYTPQAGPFGDLPDLQEITMTLSDNASFESASREFCTFLMASGYKPPTGWGSAEEVERLREKKKQIHEDLKDSIEREWVALSDKKTIEIRSNSHAFEDPLVYCMEAVESALKELNT